MGLLIQGALLEGVATDVYIEGNEIRRIGQALPVEGADRVIDGRGKALIPGFVNAHTHAAMTLFRGFGDDMPLMEWLERKIWTYEADLTADDVYWGTKLACVEMIKSGTTTFFDMYYQFHAVAAAVEEMGMRALVAGVCFDRFDAEMRIRSERDNERLFREAARYGRRIHFGVGPHAIYTVSGELLQWAHRFSVEYGVPVHLHLAETEKEVRNAVGRFGLTPVRYLHRLGVLSPHLIVAHALYVDADEVKMLADNGVTVVHNPASNMKLASGFRFLYDEMREAGIRVALGTDGCASSNNLDMIEAMKLASLLGKVWRGDPEAVPAGAIVESATGCGADALGLKAGRIAEGYLADLCLVDLNLPVFVPNHSFVSNLVYAANGGCVDTVICDGKILMEGRHVQGEEEIMEQAARCACRLVKRK